MPSDDPKAGIPRPLSEELVVTMLGMLELEDMLKGSAGWDAISPRTSWLEVSSGRLPE